jgi:hypothetical protein
MPLSNVYRKILEQIHSPRAAIGISVGTRRDEIDFDIEVEFKSQKSQECKAPFERADQNRGLIPVVAFDFLRQFDDTLLEPLLTDQYFQLMVGIRIRDFALPPVSAPSLSAR